MKLPKLLVKVTNNYRTSGIYLVSVPDLYHHEKYKFKGENGEELFLYTADSHLTTDERMKYATEVIVEATYGDTCFNVGDKVRVEHHALTDGNGDYYPFWTDENGKDYYRVMNYDVLYRIEEDFATPRKNILLCKPIREKAYETTLELPDELMFNRRDVVQVAKVWEGCTDYKEGDLLLIAKDADYYVKINGEDYVKVDTSGDFEVFAKVGSTGWRKTQVYKHHVHKHVQV